MTKSLDAKKLELIKVIINIEEEALLDKIAKILKEYQEKEQQLKQ